MSKTIERLKNLHDIYYSELQARSNELGDLVSATLELQAEIIDKLGRELDECKRKLAKAEEGQEENTDTSVCNDSAVAESVEEVGGRSAGFGTSIGQQGRCPG